MTKLFAYNYVSIGLYIRYLSDTEGKFIKNVMSEIADLVHLLEIIQFNVSVEATRKLTDVIIELEILNKPRVTIDASKKLKRILQSFEEIVHAESETKQVFIVTEKRYNTKYLLNEQEKMFSLQVYDKLPKISKYDFDEAFKCIVFERPTAAAFHLLRGSEAVLRELYLKKIKTKRMKDKDRMWSNILNAFRSRNQNKKKKPFPESLISNLDNIRENYRNPTQHPDAIYSIDKVQDLLGLCIDVVNTMVSMM